MLLGVPASLWAAFDAPDPDPVSFSLANQISFPDYLISDGLQAANWHLTAAGARLFGMPEIQPFWFRAGGKVWGGRLHLKGAGLNSGVYRELSAALGYQRALPESLSLGLELQLFQISIEDYGSAWSPQLNARMGWAFLPHLKLTFTWINLTDSHFGEGHYPLPRRLALGGMLSATKNLELFLELDQNLRYSLSPRFGMGFAPIEQIILLAGFQADPDIASVGVSGLIGRVRATAAYQYHPDLGFSQCYGITATF